MVKNRTNKKPAVPLFEFAVPRADGSVTTYFVEDEGDGNYTVLDASRIHVTDMQGHEGEARADLEGSALLRLLGLGVPVTDAHLALHRISRGTPEPVSLGEYLVSEAALEAALAVQAANDANADWQIHATAEKWARERGYVFSYCGTPRGLRANYKDGAVIVSLGVSAVTHSVKGKQNFCVNLDGIGWPIDASTTAPASYIYV